MLCSTPSRKCRAVTGLIVCYWLAACGVDAGYVVDGVWQTSDEVASAIQSPTAQAAHAFEATDATTATQPSAGRTPHACGTPRVAEFIDKPDPTTTPMAAAVTLDITSDPAQPSPWPEAHMRCDGIRIGPSVILTAAHCFAWHRGADSDAPPLALVHVRGADVQQDAFGENLGTLALHVAIHPHYPALACSQPSRSTAAACLRAASRCVAVHGRDSQQRSACLQGISEQVIEAQQHASYDLALVFVAPPAPQDAPMPYAILAREPQHGPQGDVWLSPVGASADAWRVNDAPTWGADAVALQPTDATRTSFDLWPAPAPDARLFDGALAHAPTSGERLQLLAWASRGVFETAADHGVQAVRYTRLAPHLIWLTDTIVSVGRAYPALSLRAPDIVDVGADTGPAEAARHNPFALSSQKGL